MYMRGYGVFPTNVPHCGMSYRRCAQTGIPIHNLETTMSLKMIRTAVLSVAALAMGALTTTSASAAEATLTGVHNCCNSCKKSIDAAVTGTGAKAKIDKGTITVTADDDAGVK